MEAHIDYNSSMWAKYYSQPPAEKTIEDCRSHGEDHRAYRWSPKIDPRWSDEQKQAYIEGYENR